MVFWMVKALEFAYPGKGTVIKKISFNILAGETVALLGPNGSGKTTLGKLLMGILKPGAGVVELEGKAIGSYSLGEIGSRVGYVFQNPDKQIFTSSVRAEVAFGLRYRGYSEREIAVRVDELLNYFELKKRADAFPFNLSRGEKQRLAIASIMALEPGFIIFDEPTTGLDFRRKEKFAELLTRVKDRGAGYILISHDHQFSKSNCERTLAMKEGKLICSSFN